jgi:hypothetical protein
MADSFFFNGILELCAAVHVYFGEFLGVNYSQMASFNLVGIFNEMQTFCNAGIDEIVEISAAVVGGGIGAKSMIAFETFCRFLIGVMLL